MGRRQGEQRANAKPGERGRQPGGTAMEHEIEAVLHSHFPDMEAEIELEPTTDRYNGYVVWGGFQGLTFIDRQRQVFGVLRQAFGERAMLISMIFTYTPSEYELLQAA